MTLKIELYVRKPQEPIETVEVTKSNIREVAKWCQGEVITIQSNQKDGVDVQHIKVNVQHPRNERQTKAFVGDWVLRVGYSFKIYMPLAFSNSFSKLDESPKLVKLEEGQNVDVIKNVFEENKSEDISVTREEADELDRNARGYGFEIGRGYPIVNKIETLSEDNPFIHKNWRELAQLNPDELHELLTTREEVKAPLFKSAVTDDPFEGMKRAGEKKDG